MARFVSASMMVALVCCIAASAHAQDTDDRGFDRPYLAPKLLLGLGGEMELESDLTGSASVSDDLEPTYGLGLAYVHPMLGFFAIGGQAGLSSWIDSVANDAEYERNLRFDLSIFPQVNLGVLGLLEVYGQIPIGLTLNFAGDESLSRNLGGAGWDVGTGLGYHVGLIAGARIALSNSFGLLAELGFVHHQFTHTVEASTLLGGVSVDTDVSMTQAVLNAGVYF